MVDRRRAAARQALALERGVGRASVLGLRGQYDVGVMAMARAIGRAFKGRGRDPLTYVELGQLVQLASLGVGRTFVAVGVELAAQTTDALVAGVRELAEFLGLMRGGVPTLLDDAEVGRRISQLRRREMALLRQRAAALLGAEAAQVVRARLALLPIGEAKLSEAIGVAVQAADGEFWRVERVSRTATSAAYNAAQDDGIVAVAAQMPGLRKRWTEMVNDLTGAPMDKAVGRDSMALHGQVARPGGVFVMPATDLAPSKMVGKVWSHPPNRPNDRAVLLPWQAGWGIPAWEMRGGSRVEMG